MARLCRVLRARSSTTCVRLGRVFVPRWTYAADQFKAIREQDTVLACDATAASTAVRADVRWGNTDEQRRPVIRGVVQKQREQQSY